MEVRYGGRVAVIHAAAFGWPAALRRRLAAPNESVIFE